MKIEMCEGAAQCISWTAACTAAVLIAWMIYKYNALAFEKGYTQEQLQNSQMVIWVKSK